jgi:AraC-like DNA-binding protein
MRTVWEHGWFEMASATPHPALQASVVGDYLGWTEQTTRPVRRREVASTIVPIIINFGAPYRVFGGADATAGGQLRGSFAAGLYDTWAAVEGGVHSCALQVNLTPFAAHALFRVPMSSLHSQSEDLSSLLGVGGRQLIEELGNCKTWAERFACLDRFLRARLASASRLPAELLRSWQLLTRSNGRVPIAALVDDAGWSARRLINTFREYVGVPPSTVAGIRRFEQAIALLDGPELSMRGRWSALALECGYSDQSHFIREFNRFAGCSPTAYVRGQIADGGGVVAE